MDLGIEGVTEAVKIGRGGFATVYRARQEAFDRDVAVKVLDIRPDEEKLQRFSREARAMGALGEHRSILPLFDAGTTAGGSPYLLMPYMSGGSLRDRLDRGEHLSWRAAFQMGAVLADALQAAHAEGILHRDLKPGNILIGRYGDPVLADFGIARIAGGPETTAGTVTASIAHAAPEVLDGRGPSTASDVYGLASTIYALITGHGPHEVPGDESVLPLITRTLSDPVPQIDGTPRHAQAVLQSAMAKDPATRPQSAAVFADALRVAAHPTRNPTTLPTSQPKGGPRATVRTSGALEPRPAPLSDEVSSGRGLRHRLIAAGVAVMALLAVGVVAILTSDEPRSAPSSISLQAEPLPVLDPQVLPRDQPQLNGLVSPDIITAWADEAPSVAVASGVPVQLALPPGAVRTSRITVPQGQVLVAMTVGDEVDTALGVLGDNEVFLRADGTSGLDDNAFIGLPLPRGGVHTLGIANVGVTDGVTTLLADIISTTPITGPGPVASPSGDGAVLAGYRFSVNSGGVSSGVVPAPAPAPGPGGRPGPTITTGSLQTLTAGAADDEVLVWVVDDRGRIRAQGQAAMVEVSLDRLDAGVFTLLVMAPADAQVTVAAR